MEEYGSESYPTVQDSIMLVDTLISNRRRTKGDCGIAKEVCSGIRVRLTMGTLILDVLR